MTSETQFSTYTDDDLREAFERGLREAEQADRSMTLATILVFSFWAFVVGFGVGRWVG